METKKDLMEHIAKLSRMARRRPAGEHHISRGGHRLLGIVLENDGIRTTDLAEQTDIRPASLTDVLKRLDDDGYIRREKDENDSRVIRIYATEKARDEYVRREADRKAQNERLLTYLTDDEAAGFCEVCDKLCVFFENEYPQEPGGNPCGHPWHLAGECGGKCPEDKQGNHHESHQKGRDGEHGGDHGGEHGRGRHHHDETRHE